jgi:hypothetical protein
VAIVVQCPHCETKFNLQPDMIGKSMRCPNLDCRQVFTVRPQGREVEPPKSEPLPPPPVVEARVVEAKVVEAAVVAPPKVKEVVWSDGVDVPPPRGKTAPRPLPLDDGPDEPVVRRKKKKSRGPVILIGMSVVIVLLVGAGVFYVLRIQGEAEKTLAKQAEGEYGKGEYAAAAKSFEKLAAEYPDSDQAPRYQFFADLAGTQVVVRAVTNRENPDPAVERMKKFLSARKDSPFAKHTSGFGRDILEAGRKLGEDVAGHADDRVKAFRSDRSGKAGELERAEKAVATGRELLPALEPFRAPDDPSLDPVRKDLDAVEAAVKRERERTAAIAKARADLEEVSDATIQRVENDLAAAGFESDDEARQMVAAAKGRLLELVRYEVDIAEPRAAPESAAATILFVAPIGPTRRAPPPGIGEEAPPAIFLAVARGILYAVDEEGGTPLWAVRVGTDVTDPPTVARVDLSTGPTDVALVTSNVAGASSIAAYVLRTGAPLWYQPLELPDPKDPKKSAAVPAAGPPVVIGSRVFVPLRDERGTIFEFDLTTGTRRGRIRLGQPVGHNTIVVRPGTGLLYAAADARRVYVIDARARDDDGNPLPLRCVQVIATGHLPGTLRTPPLLLGPEGDAPADRWMILSQSAGRTMSLRAFRVLPVPAAPVGGSAPPEVPAAPEVELPVNGWAWYPPAGDGERIAVATDFGQLRVFGVNQFESLDKPLFPYSDPRPALPAPPEGRAVRGVVFPAEEGAFWAVVNGNLQKFRVGLVPSRAVEVFPGGPSVPVGEPTQPPQLNNGRNAAFLVVRSLNSSGYRAVLVNLRDGEVRWQRQLGLLPAAPPFAQGDGLLLVAEDGAMVAVPAASGARAGRTTAAPEDWVVAAPHETATGPTSVAASADGKTLFTVTPVLAVEDRKEVAKFVVRRVAGGRVVHEGTVNAPGSLAGPPVVVGDSLLLPVSDAFVYRHEPGVRPSPDTLSAGPLWATDRRPDDGACHITPLSASAFLTGDGSKRLTKWDWPAGGRWNPTGLTWELRERPAGPGVVLPASGGPPRFLIADVTGSVWLFATDRSGKELRRWKPGGGMPVGRPSSPLAVRADPDGRTLVALTVANRHIVCLDPDRDLPLWAVTTGEDADAIVVGAPQPAAGGRWLATGLAGRVTVYDGPTGRAEATLEIGLPGTVPAASAGPLGASSVLAALSDGSSVVVPLAPIAPGGP